LGNTSDGICPIKYGIALVETHGRACHDQYRMHNCHDIHLMGFVRRGDPLWSPKPQTPPITSSDVTYWEKNMMMDFIHYPFRGYRKCDHFILHL